MLGMQALVSHCRIWGSRLQNLLHSSGQREMGALHAHIKAMAEAMQHPITDMRTLSEAMALLDKLQDEATNFEARFEPLESRYAALARFEVCRPPIRALCCGPLYCLRRLACVRAACVMLTSWGLQDQGLEARACSTGLNCPYRKHVLGPSPASSRSISSLLQLF